jgi:hypothetical protein
MLNVLKKIFNANPEKSKITINGRCSACGCKVIIEISQTSGGYGLQGGALVKCSPEKYSITCSKCYKLNPKLETSCKSRHACALSFSNIV